MVIDTVVNNFFVHYTSSALATPATVISHVGGTVVLSVVGFLVAIIFVAKKKLRDGAVIILSLGMASFGVFVLKEIFMRLRPENSLIIESGYSFPSGHATISITFFLVLGYIIYPNLHSRISKIVFATISILAVLAIGVSRLILNVHWATDIIFGWFLGIVSVGIAIVIAGRWRKE